MSFGIKISALPSASEATDLDLLVIVDHESSTTKQLNVGQFKSSISGSGTSGTSGISGTSGTSGTSGIGISGTSGTSGTSGINGTSGTSGTSGITPVSASYADFALTASYAQNAGGGGSLWTSSLDGLISRNSDVGITGSLQVSGSTKFGTTSTDIHQFTGSVKINDKLILNKVNDTEWGNFKLIIADDNWSWFGAGRISNTITSHDGTYVEPYSLINSSELLLSSSENGVPQGALYGMYNRTIFHRSGSFDTASFTIIGMSNDVMLGDYFGGFKADTSLTKAVGLRSRIQRPYISGQPIGSARLLTASAFEADLYINSVPGTIDNYFAYFSDLSGKSAYAVNQFHFYGAGNAPSYFGGSLEVSGSTHFGNSSTDTHQFTGSVDVNGIISSNKIGGELRSYQLPDSHYISVKTEGAKSGLYRSNTDFFSYYDTNTGDTVMDATFPGGNLLFHIMGVEKAKIDANGNYFISGSSKFGNSSTDTHQFTGSVDISDTATVGSTLYCGDGNNVGIAIKLGGGYRNVFMPSSNIAGKVAIQAGGGTQGLELLTEYGRSIDMRFGTNYGDGGDDYLANAVNLYTIWENSLIDFKVINIDITDNASNSGSKFINGKLNGVSKFSVDKNGGAIFSGSVEIASGSAIILTSPNGTRYKITVDDAGVLTTTAI